MSTKMDGADWALALDIFQACLPRVGAKAKEDRLFLEALHCFTVHNITWRALPEKYGHWNSVWKRFDRLGKSGVFEDYFSMLAGLSETADIVQMFDSTVIRAHVSAAGAKGGNKAKPLGAPGVGSAPKPIWKQTMMACQWGLN